MSFAITRTLADALLAVAHPWTGSSGDVEPALELAADKRVVLIGEASHGTPEFYRIRAELTGLPLRSHARRRAIGDNRPLDGRSARSSGYLPSSL